MVETRTYANTHNASHTHAQIKTSAWPDRGIHGCMCCVQGKTGQSPKEAFVFIDIDMGDIQQLHYLLATVPICDPPADLKLAIICKQCTSFILGLVNQGGINTI